MTQRLSVESDASDIAQMERRYGSAQVQRALAITRTYTEKLQREARSILREKGHVDTGGLIQRIQPEVSVDDSTIAGQVNAGTEYARFLHEGAKHKGEELNAHFVPFRVAPSLLLWAKRNEVIYQEDGKWNMKARSGKEYPVDIRKGGLMVKQEAVKYFEIPFERLAPQYFEKIREAL